MRASIPFRERIACSFKEACEAIDVGPTTLKELVATGKIETRKIRRRRVVLVKSLIEAIEGKEAA